MPTINVNGTEIYYERNGSGEPILLIPGLGLDHSYYGLGEPVLRQSMETVLVDPRGIGKSRKDNVEYSVELWADDFAVLIEKLELGNAHVLGSSLGGATALAMGVRHPEKVKSLILVGSLSELTRSVEMNFLLRKKLVAKLGMGEEIREFVLLWTLTSGFMDTDLGDMVMEAGKENLQKISPDLYVRFLASILKLGRRLPGQEIPALTASLKSIIAPTLVMCSDNDHLIPKILSKIIAENISGSSYVEISGGGHIPFIERPKESASVVIDFIKSMQ